LHGYSEHHTVNCARGHSGFAAQNGHVEIVKELVKAGADVNAKDGNGYLAVVQAAQNGYVEIVKELVKAGADVNAKDGYGRLAVVLAAQNGHVEIVKELVKAGADVNAKDGDERGRLAVVLAAHNGHVEIVKELVKAGADVNAKDGYGYLAVVEAAQNGHVEIVKELVKAGADVNAKSGEGKLAFVLAAHNGHVGVTENLLDTCSTRLQVRDIREARRKAYGMGIFPNTETVTLIDNFLASSLHGVAERSGVEIQDFKHMSDFDFTEHLSELGYNKVLQSKLRKLREEL
jgi:ankyrin repeat protein